MAFLELFFLSVKILNTYTLQIIKFCNLKYLIVYKIYYLFISNYAKLKIWFINFFFFKNSPVYNTALFTQRWSDVYDFFIFVPMLSIIVLALIHNTYTYVLSLYTVLCPRLYTILFAKLQYYYLNANCLAPTAHHSVLTKYILYGLPGNVTILWSCRTIQYM